MQLDLSGKRALVTGASSGLGLHFAGVLSAAGAEVTLAARRIDKVATLAAGLPNASATALDVTDPASVAALFDGTSFDVVINNAGIALDRKAIETSTEDFQQVIDTNLTGVFSVARAAAQSMQRQGGGRSSTSLRS